MSTAKTNFAENLVATWMLTASAATRPTAWFVAPHSADPGGNPLYKDALASPRTILNGDRLEIAAGVLTLRGQ
jgi:hypothetical protein